MATLLKMYRADTLVEVGTEGNPIDFGLCLAGESTDLAYQIMLYNDKENSIGADDAKDLILSLLQLNAIQNWVSDGNPSQTFNTTYYPQVENAEEVTVDGTKWARVDSLAGYGSTDEVYTLDHVTGELIFGNGAQGKIPTLGLTISINYVPDLNIFGKEVYAGNWVSVMSSGVTAFDISITLELATKIDDDHIQLLHYPYVSAIVGVWDNSGKTGTNYYTGGSVDPDTGIVTLGSTMVAPNPYVEYSYRIKDDGDTIYTVVGFEATYTLTNRIPKTNAKKLYLRITLPTTASSEGGAYIQVRLRVSYNY